uniref:Uncharacterized protein n=1 Tax=Panagrolaimus davidi TaxID=227884 RepID=A0A914PHJ5_9BILA
MTALMRLNHIPKDDERILIINNMIDQFTVIELLRGYQGYAIIEKREIQCPDDCTNYKKLRSDILGENKATKIFVNSLVPTQKMNLKMNEKLKHHILKNETYIINEDDHILLSNSPMEGLAKAACAIVQNMYNPSYTLYHIIPSCHSDYCVSKKKKQFGKVLIQRMNHFM